MKLVWWRNDFNDMWGKKVGGETTSTFGGESTSMLGGESSWWRNDRIPTVWLACRNSRNSYIIPSKIKHIFPIVVVCRLCSLPYPCNLLNLQRSGRVLHVVSIELFRAIKSQVSRFPSSSNLQVWVFLRLESLNIPSYNYIWNCSAS